MIAQNASSALLSVIVEPAWCHSRTALSFGAPRRRLHRGRRASIGRCSSLISAWSRARSSWRFDAPSPARSSMTLAGLATLSPWSSTMSSCARARRPVHHDPLDPVGASWRDHVRPARRLRHPPVRPGTAVAQPAAVAGGEKRGAVPAAQQAWSVADGVDAMEDRDEPADPNPPVDLIIAETEAPRLPAAHHAALPLSKRNDLPLHPFWAGSTVHITVYPAQNWFSPPEGV